MILSPEVYKKIKSVVFTRLEPSVTTVFWARPSNPEGNGFDFFVYDNGEWQLLNQYENVIIPKVDAHLSAFINDVNFYSIPLGGIPLKDLSSAVQNALNNAYQIPSTGIPKTDLSSSVQSSLNKADTALQEETDPTVPSWAKSPTKPSYTAQEVGALPNSTKYGSTIGLTMDSATYVLTLSLKDQDGTVLNTKTVDLPIESVVVNGRYDAINKKIVLTLQSGSTIDVPIGDLVAGLQTEITSVNMLDADLVDDTNSSHKFVTEQEKQNWNNKSNFSGDYNDLANKPTIPSKTSDLTNDSKFVSANSQTFTDAEKQQARQNIGAAGTGDVPTLPDNVSYFSNDSGEGIVPMDGIRGKEIVASAEININPDVVTFITGEVGSNTNITLTVPNDALWHVWDMFLTTAADGGATIVVPTGSTLHVPSGYSIVSGKTYEIRVIGKGLNYYLAYGEFA